MTIEFRRLTKADSREGFTCGVPELDLFFHKYAKQNQYRHYLGVTYVAVRQSHILGFATVSPCHIEAESLSVELRGKLPLYPLPMLRLARLGVSSQAQGGGIGKLLLRGVFTLALGMRDELGCVGLVTDAKPQAVSFYQRYGFRRCGVPIEGQVLAPPSPLPMFLSIKVIAKAAQR